MPKSLLARLIASPEFTREVSGMIMDQVVDRDCVARPEGRPVTGAVVDYELTGNLRYGAPTGEGVRFNLPFVSSGTASGSCAAPGGGEHTFARDGAIRGVIRLDLGPEALTLERIEEILDSTIIEIVLSQVDVDENPRRGVPAEAFAGEA